MSDIENRIRKFIEELNLLKDKQFSLDLRLREDLGIYGEDADEFFEIFRKQFDVDLADLDLKKFFPSELDYFYFFRKLFSLINKENSKYAEISLRHLLEICNEGRWFDPESNSGTK